MKLVNFSIKNNFRLLSEKPLFIILENLFFTYSDFLLQSSLKIRIFKIIFNYNLDYYSYLLNLSIFRYCN